MSGKRQAALGFIFVTVLVDVIGFGIIIPILPELIKELIGGTNSQASTYGGWLLMAFAAMQFLFSPTLGSLSDKYGRRPVLLTALFGFGLDYLFLAFAPSIGWLFVGRIIAGITGASFTTASAYIADVSTPEKRAQNFGMMGVAFGVGFIIGPALGGQLSHFGLRFPFYVAAGLTFLNWLYGFFILPESLPKEQRRAFDWKRANPLGSLMVLRKYPVLSGMAFSIFLLFIAAHAVQSTWAFFTIEKFHWDAPAVGYSLAVVGILVAAVQGGLIRIIIPKLGQKRSVYAGFTLYIIGMVLMSMASQSWMLYVFLVPYCLGGIAGPALQGIISNQVPANEQGELQGTLTSLQSLTTIIGPIVMTSLFAFYTSKSAPVYFPGAPFIAGAVLTFFSLLLAMRSLRHYKNDPIPVEGTTVEQPVEETQEV